jgi:flagellar hook assembly protein FlgD
MGKVMLPLFSLIILFSQQLYAVDIKNVVAYPVPFDPHKNKLTIGYPQSGGNFLAVENRAEVTVFDINGDIVTVINRSPSGKIACIWNGRKSNGEYVKPGLYLIKVEISSTDGGYWKKVLRVLVKY